MRRHLALRATVAIAAAVLAGASGASRAVAQESSSAPSAPGVPAGVSLVSQTTWSPLRAAFVMRLHLDDPALAARPGAAIAVRIHESTSSRIAFDDVIGARDLGGVVSQPDLIPVASLQPDAKHNVTLTFGLSGSGIRPTIPINRPGVYPVEVSLVTGVPSGSFVTWLVTVDDRTDTPIDKKLSVAMVWQLLGDPSGRTDGTPDPALAAQLKPHGRLDRIATLLDRAKGVPITAIVGPETVESWRKLAERDSSLAPGLARLRRAAGRPTTELLPAPYVPIDLPAFESAGFGSHLSDEYGRGSDVLKTTLGTAPAAGDHPTFVEPVDDAAVDRLRGMHADRVAVRDGSLIPTTHPFTPAQTFVLDTNGGRSRGATTAPFVENLLNGHDPAALKAERVIAALAEVAYETPAIARGLVLAPAARWSPDITTMNTILEALRNNPLVQPVTLADFFSQVTTEQVNGFDAERRLQPASPGPTPISLGEYDAAAAQVDSYRDVVGPNDPVVVNGEHALLVALSTAITPAQAHALLSTTDGAVHAFEAGITTDAKRVTLTARRAKVPLSFVNSLKPPRAVDVRVHLESPKLVFPDGADQVVRLKPGNNTIPFTVEARTSGTFPMTITVSSANGRIQFGAPVRVTVRSAVFGGLAVGLTIAAVAFLALWWANHLRRTRRGRRIAATTAPAS